MTEFFSDALMIDCKASELLKGFDKNMSKEPGTVLRSQSGVFGGPQRGYLWVLSTPFSGRTALRTEVLGASS